MNALQSLYSKLDRDAQEVAASRLMPLLLGLVSDQKQKITLTPANGKAKKARKSVEKAMRFRVYQFDLKKPDAEPKRLTNTVKLDTAKVRRKELAQAKGCKWQFVTGMPGSGWYMTPNGRYGLVIVDLDQQAKMKEHNAMIETIERELAKLTPKRKTVRRKK